MASFFGKLVKQGGVGKLTGWFDRLRNRTTARLRTGRRTLGSGLEALEQRTLLAGDLLQYPIDQNFEHPPVAAQVAPAQPPGQVSTSSQNSESSAAHSAPTDTDPAAITPEAVQAAAAPLARHTPEQQRLLDQIDQENGGDWTQLTADQMQRLRDAGLVVHRYDGWGGYDYEVVRVGDKFYVYYEPWWGNYQLQQVTPDTLSPQAAVDIAWNRPTDAPPPRNSTLTPEQIEAKFRELYQHDPDAIRLLDLLKERGWRIELRDFYLHDWYIYEHERILALDHDGWMFELTPEEAAHQLYDMLSTGLYGRTHELVGEHIVLEETDDSYWTRKLVGTGLVVLGGIEFLAGATASTLGAGVPLVVFGGSTFLEGVDTFISRGGGINPGEYLVSEGMGYLWGEDGKIVGMILYNGAEVILVPIAAVKAPKAADKVHDAVHIITHRPTDEVVEGIHYYIKVTRLSHNAEAGSKAERWVREVYDIGEKTAIYIFGRKRIPDGINHAAQTVNEVKNVQKLDFTQQLRDMLAWAKQEGYTFVLYIRRDTQLSGPLREAIQAGEIQLRYIP